MRKVLEIVSVNDFIAAGNKLEAVTRLSALTGAPPETLGPGSKERKSVLVNLATDMSLDVNLAAEKPELGRQIAVTLGMAWTPDCWSAGQTITLVGLNRILSGAHREVSNRRRQASASPTTFIPGRSKLEVVTRISSLTSGPPQSLGPGSKERKSVLTNLIKDLDLNLDLDLSKPELARAIVVQLGGGWDESCWSAGQTITLEGLNRVLESAEQELSRRGVRDATLIFQTPDEEAAALLNVLEFVVPPKLDGRLCITEMLEAESKNWAQSEWPGWYFEFVGLPAMINAFAGGPVSYGRTSFDYGFISVWDLKTHGADSNEAPLNDISAVELCLAERGLGFIVLTGVSGYEDDDFRAWHDDLKKTKGKVSRARAVPAKTSRALKSTFVPTRLDVFYLHDLDALSKARADKRITVMAQGQQISGAPRNPKFKINLRRSVGTDVHIASALL